MSGIAPIFHSLRFHNLPRSVIEQRLSEAKKLHSAKITPLTAALQRARENPFSKKTIALAIVSSDLQYPVREIAKTKDGSAAVALGDVTRLLASYCSDPIL